MTHTFRASAGRVGHACCVLYAGEMPRLSKAGAVRHGIYAGDPFTDATALSDAGAEVFHQMRDVNALVGLN